jgi:hypothetical protein
MRAVDELRSTIPLAFHSGLCRVITSADQGTKLIGVYIGFKQVGVVKAADAKRPARGGWNEGEALPYQIVLCFNKLDDALHCLPLQFLCPG